MSRARRLQRRGAFGTVSTGKWFRDDERISLAHGLVKMKKAIVSSVNECGKMATMSTRRLFALVAVLDVARCQLQESGLGDSADGAADVVSDVAFADVTDERLPTDGSSDILPSEASSDAGFSPPDISGLALWLRSDLGTTLQNGVVTWADSSGSNDPSKTLNQASTSAQPSYNSTDNAYNGHPSVAFSASENQTLVSGKWLVPLSQPFSMFVVGNLDGSTAPEMIMTSQGSNVIELFSNNGNVGVGIYAGSFVYGSAGPSGSPEVYGGIFADGTSAVFQSALTPTGTGSVFPSYTFTNLTLGSVSNSKFLNGKIVEVTIYSGVVANADLAALMSYFSARYGLSIGP